jgi:predicted HTH domain antitoxin
MQSVVLEIPSELLFHIKIPDNKLILELKKELAVQLYRDRLLSFVNCSRLAEMGKVEFHFLLGEKKIPRHYDVEDFNQDLETLKELDFI